MWPFKKKENPVIAFPKVCNTCGCLFARWRGKSVAAHHAYGGCYFYCDGCAPPYDRVEQRNTGREVYYKTSPAHEVEVTEKGKPIGIR